MDGVVPCKSDLNNLGPVSLRIFDCIPGSRCNSFQPSFVLVQCPPSLASMRVFERRPNLWLPGGVTMGKGQYYGAWLGRWDHNLFRNNEICVPSASLFFKDASLPPGTVLIHAVNRFFASQAAT